MDKTGTQKISVIIPVYNTEKYVERCVESVMRQTWHDLEILLVNDGSEGEIETIAARYMEEDPRIRLLSHDRNMGLYRARLTGLRAASGDYIGFVDSDDHVSEDYYRTLLQKAEDTQAEIVIGRTVREEEGRRFIYNLHEACLPKEVVEGEEIRDLFFGQEFRCYAWHTMWNKLYKRSLFDRCLPDLVDCREHIVMGEDILFSTVLMSRAGRLATVFEEAYFYCANEEAATSGKGLTPERLQKILRDLSRVFERGETYLCKKGTLQQERAHFVKGRQFYSTLWRETVKECLTPREQKEIRKCLSSLGRPLPYPVRPGYMESLRTPWEGKLEYLKKRIRDPKYTCLSFDLFDTLLVRPFGKPEDLFLLLDQPFRRISGSGARFSDLRIRGEKEARETLCRTDPDREDVTLEEIYEAICRIYAVGKQTADRMKELEKALEVRYTKPREAGRSLYRLARHEGKRVVFTTDMYLPEETIRRILVSSGYAMADRLYLSSRKGRIKRTGGLFRCLLEGEGLMAEEVLHIGDDWEKDVEGASLAGISALFFPRASDVFENRIAGCVTNRCGSLGSMLRGRLWDPSEKPSAGADAMKSLAAQWYFDDPYRPFHPKSDLNMDPSFLGWYTVGMHLLGLCRWLYREAEEQGLREILFCGRDGYLLCQAFGIYTRDRPADIRAGYLPVSRRALLPVMVKNGTDLFQLPVDPLAQTPERMLVLLAFCSRPYAPEERRRELLQAGIPPGVHFRDKGAYEAFIRLFLEKWYDEKRHREAQRLVRRHCARIRDGSGIFDMGYSGRIPEALSWASGKRLKVFYIHEEPSDTGFRKQEGRMEICSFYPFRPAVTGLLREYLLSEPAGSCVRYTEEQGEVVPVYERMAEDAGETVMLRCLQRNALLFVKRYQKLFGDAEETFGYRPEEVSLPFEGVLYGLPPADTGMYGRAVFEDLLYGGSRRIRVDGFAKEHMAQEAREQAGEPEGRSSYEIMLPVLNRRPKAVRAMMILLGAPEIFGQKLRKNIGFAGKEDGKE